MFRNGINMFISLQRHVYLRYVYFCNLILGLIVRLVNQGLEHSYYVQFVEVTRNSEKSKSYFAAQ